MSCDFADLNGDGHTDLVISSYWENGFKIHFGSGNGNFLPGIYMATGVHGREIKCADVNKDGKMDIVATTSGSGQTISLHVFINKGDGNFFPKKSYPSTLDTCKEIIITDKNNDGLPDIVISSSFPWVLFYFQQEDGSFAPKYWETYTTAQVAFSDLDDDSREDMLLLYTSWDNLPGSDSIVIRLSQDDTHFSSSIRVPHFENKNIRPSQLVTGDINGDGYTDIIMNHHDLAGNYTDTIYYMTGRAGVTFNAPEYLLMPGNVRRIGLADMNTDGLPDLLASCDNNMIAVSLNGIKKSGHAGKSIVVYPNPSSGRIFIKGLEEKPYTVKLSSVHGNLLYYGNSDKNFWQYDLSRYPAGVYFIEFIYRTRRFIHKVIKQ
jgi:hypothetical protein